jgi:hypothetical protein
MTNRLSIPAHGALELLVGLSLLGLAFATGPAGLVAGAVAGTLIAGLALSGAQTLPLRTHQALDQALVAAMAGGALAMALHGEEAATLLLGGGALAELLLLWLTRWTRR